MGPTQKAINPAALPGHCKARPRVTCYTVIPMQTFSMQRWLTAVCWCRQRVQPKRGLVPEAGVSGTSTEDSRASRPKRAVQRFDYNVLNGSSGNLTAMLHAAGEKLSCVTVVIACCSVATMTRCYVVAQSRCSGPFLPFLQPGWRVLLLPKRFKDMLVMST